MFLLAKYGGTDLCVPLLIIFVHSSSSVCFMFVFNSLLEPNEQDAFYSYDFLDFVEHHSIWTWFCVDRFVFLNEFLDFFFLLRRELLLLLLRRIIFGSLFFLILVVLVFCLQEASLINLIVVQVELLTSSFQLTYFDLVLHVNLVLYLLQLHHGIKLDLILIHAFKLLNLSHQSRLHLVLLHDYALHCLLGQGHWPVLREYGRHFLVNFLRVLLDAPCKLWLRHRLFHGRCQVTLGQTNAIAGQLYDFLMNLRLVHRKLVHQLFILFVVIMAVLSQEPVPLLAHVLIYMH